MAWNLNEFRKILDEYKRLYLASTDQKEKEKYLSYISTVKHEIAVEELTKYERENLKQETMTVGEHDVVVNLDDGTCFGELTNNIFDVSSYELYYDYLKNFRDKLKSILTIQEYEFKEEGKLNISRDDMLDIIHDIFKSTTKEIYNMFLKIDKDDISFDPTMDADDGSSFSFPIINKNFIEVGTNGDQEETLWTLSHETGHVLGAMFNQMRYTGEDKYVEIESHFFELVGLDYLTSIFKENYYTGKMKKRLFEYYDLSKKMIAMKNVVDNTFDNLNKVENPYKYYSNLSKTTEDYRDSDVPDNMKYIIGYITALELFEVYKQDKELAIDLLKKIIVKDDSKTEYQRIVENVNLNEHVEEHVKRLGLHR